MAARWRFQKSIATSCEGLSWLIQSRLIRTSGCLCRLLVARYWYAMAAGYCEMRLILRPSILMKIAAARMLSLISFDMDKWARAVSVR